MDDCEDRDYYALLCGARPLNSVVRRYAHKCVEYWCSGRSFSGLNSANGTGLLAESAFAPAPCDGIPTPLPTPFPTNPPSPPPTEHPTPFPTFHPTPQALNPQPSLPPSAQSSAPSAFPEPSQAPTPPLPSLAPSSPPSPPPTPRPTPRDSGSPSRRPTPAPTSPPSVAESSAPSVLPSSAPSAPPSLAPTLEREIAVSGVLVINPGAKVTEDAEVSSLYKEALEWATCLGLELVSGGACLAEVRSTLEDPLDSGRRLAARNWNYNVSMRPSLGIELGLFRSADPQEAGDTLSLELHELYTTNNATFTSFLGDAVRDGIESGGGSVGQSYTADDVDDDIRTIEAAWQQIELPTVQIIDPPTPLPTRQPSPAPTASPAAAGATAKGSSSTEMTMIVVAAAVGGLVLLIVSYVAKLIADARRGRRPAWLSFLGSWSPMARRSHKRAPSKLKNFDMLKARHINGSREVVRGVNPMVPSNLTDTPKTATPSTSGSGPSPEAAEGWTARLSRSFFNLLSANADGRMSNGSSIAPGWEEMHDHEGNAFYHNAQTNRSTWTRPFGGSSAIAPAAPPPFSVQTPFDAHEVDDDARSVDVGDRPAPLPPGWEECTSEGRVYYWHPETGTSTWERPTAEPHAGPLPDGWRFVEDERGNGYYINEETNEVQWNRP